MLVISSNEKQDLFQSQLYTCLPLKEGKLLDSKKEHNSLRLKERMSFFIVYLYN
jgi:hypothetical protein